MDTNEIKEKVQSLIIDGKLEDAAEELIEYLDGDVMGKKEKRLVQLYNLSVFQISQLNELKNARLSGIVDPEDFDRKRNQIRMALLDINNRIAEFNSGNRVPRPIPVSPVNNTGAGGGGSKNSILYVIIGVLAAGLIGLGAMFFMDGNETASTKDSEPTYVGPKDEKPSTNNSRNQENAGATREETARKQREAEEKRRQQAEEQRKREAEALTEKTDAALKKVKSFQYSNITGSDVKLLDSKLSSGKINGSNDKNNRIATGSVLIYKTSKGRYGKMQIVKYGKDLQLKSTTYNSNGSVYKSTNSLTIRATYGCDLDKGVTGQTDRDFFWQHSTSVKRYLSPQNGAKFYVASKKMIVPNLNPRLVAPVVVNPAIATLIMNDYTRLSYDKVKSYYSKMRMSSIDGNTKLKKGSILAFRAGTRRYGKMEILENGYDLKIRAIIYESNGSVYKSTKGLTIKGTYSCDLDKMIQSSSGMDFKWEHQSSTKKYLRPRDQAVFYQVK